MFATFITKAAVKVIPKIIANPLVAVELAPVIAVVGAGVAIYEMICGD